MEAFLNKKYKLVRHDECFDKFLKVLGKKEQKGFSEKFLTISSTGFTWLEAKLAKQIPTVVELTKADDGFYHLLTNVKVFTRDQKFQPNVEIEQKSVEGSIVKNIFQIEGDRLIETQVGEKTVIITRVFSETGIKATLFCDNVETKTFCEVISWQVLEINQFENLKNNRLTWL